ncbi:hypothetical protein RIF29_39412 [Crotalaria pallida]|uniref:GRF-type domain-containing protein n=1 Tax=Crotalaria pallida TaxID=3830 RepID=A0AAN9E172_CROPI
MVSSSSHRKSMNDGHCKANSNRHYSCGMDSPLSSMNTATSISQYGYEGIPPYCGCGGARAVLRTARTKEHYGMRFWGCRFYKKDVPDSGCNFFDWYKDDIVHEKELIITKQRMEMDSIKKEMDSINKEMDSMKKDLDFSTKWMKILLVICIGPIIVVELLLFLEMLSDAEGVVAGAESTLVAFAVDALVACGAPLFLVWVWAGVALAGAAEVWVWVWVRAGVALAGAAAEVWVWARILVGSLGV